MDPPGVRVKSPAAIARWVAIGVSGVWALVIWQSGLDLDDGTRRWISYLPSVVGGGIVAWDLWLWKVPGLNKMTGRPRVYGTWRATLRTNDKSRIPKGGTRGAIPAVMVIEQTFWTFSIQFHTEQSSSGSITASLVSQQDSRDNKELCFTYANRARQEHNERSLPHHGTCLLRVGGNSPKHMDGTYWTDRLTAGDITLERLDRKTGRSAHEARTLAGIG